VKILFLQAKVIKDGRKSLITTIEDPSKEKYFRLILL